jgi:hypothetical protein
MGQKTISGKIYIIGLPFKRIGGEIEAFSKMQRHRTYHRTRMLFRYTTQA